MFSGSGPFKRSKEIDNITGCDSPDILNDGKQPHRAAFRSFKLQFNLFSQTISPRASFPETA